MNPAILSNPFAALTAALCGVIARHGHLRRLAGPLVVLLWGRVQTISALVATLLARRETGQLRRYPARRPPRTSTAPRRRPAPSVLPRKSGWLIALLPETAASAAQLQSLLAGPDIPALLHEAPQLRRTLRPLCRMLGVKLPQAAAPQPAPESPQAPPRPPPGNHHTTPPPEAPPAPPPCVIGRPPWPD